jgi:glucose/arabinose dehydrogenase
MFRFVFVIGTMLAAGPVASATIAAQQSPFAGPTAFDSSDFRVTVFANGLNFPYGMIILPDGSLLYGSSVPIAGGGSYFASTGELIRVTDQNDDGVADDEGTVLAKGMPGTITALERAGNLIAVTSAEVGKERISFLRRGADWSSPLELVGSINFDCHHFEHQSYGLLARKHAGSNDECDLFFNIGAHGNDAAGATVPTSGLITATLDDATVYMVTIKDSGPGKSPAVSAPVLIATGLRNAMAMAFEPGPGDLLLVDNGIDGLEHPREPLSVDELDRIPADKIGGDPEDFGFPESYIEYRTGAQIGSGGIAPEMTFQPIDGSESEGPAGMAIAPPDFPKGLNHGVFIGFHGQFDWTGQDNEENPLVYADPSTSEYRHVIENREPGVGHLDSLLSTNDTLYVADLCADSSLAKATPCGVIYEIRVVGGAATATPVATP